MPPVLAGIFLLTALSAFIMRYWNLGAVEFPSIVNNLYENRILFYLNFYIPFSLFIPSLFGYMRQSRFYKKLIICMSSFIFSVMSSYILNDLFPIKFSIYAAFIIINAASFTPLIGCLINGISIFLYTIILVTPSILGTDIGGFSFYKTFDLSQICLFFILLGTLAALIAYIKFLSEKNSVSQDTVNYLNSITTQLSIFNHRLQEYAKTSSDEAVKTDRLRFTRDLHDRCGYVFTIIITLAEAAISFGDPITERVEAALHKIRKQAKEGLQQTREILYMIREMQDPWIESIDVIYKMKAIFEDVTGIKVDIEAGNIGYSYSKGINKILARILQEAFTNSMRHGKASHILVHFWEFPEELTMTITDNGIGSKNVVKRIGLTGMEERLALVGGTVDASSPEDGGFRIRVKIPVTSLKEDDTIMMEELTNGRSGSSYSLGR